MGKKEKKKKTRIHTPLQIPTHYYKSLPIALHRLHTSFVVPLTLSTRETEREISRLLRSQTSVPTCFVSQSRGISVFVGVFVGIAIHPTTVFGPLRPMEHVGLMQRGVLRSPVFDLQCPGHEAPPSSLPLPATGSTSSLRSQFPLA